jgi:hypothetical protein
LGFLPLVGSSAQRCLPSFKSSLISNGFIWIYC